MCRFLVWVSHEPVALADVVLTPANSMLVQCLPDRDGQGGATGTPHAHTLNADGFGLGWYGGTLHRAAIFRSVTPAWNNRNLRELCRSVESPCFMAHVRASGPGPAGPGVVNEESCHPFRYGNLLFQHNGAVRCFHKIRQRVLAEVREDVYDAIDGKTDSEACFALVLSLLDPAVLARNSRVAPADMVAATKGAIALVLYFLCEAGVEQEGEPGDTFSTFNFALTDGHSVVVTRFCDQAASGVPPPSLFYAFGDEDWDDAASDEDSHYFRQAHGAFLCASEPLSSGNAWRPIEAQSLLCYTLESLGRDLVPMASGTARASLQAGAGCGKVDVCRTCDKCGKGARLSITPIGLDEAAAGALEAFRRARRC